MAKQKSSHVHKYKRKFLGKKGYTVYACALPGCLHYIRRELAEGKESICHRCGKVFKITRLDLRRAKPHCKGCTKKTGFARSQTEGNIRESAADAVLKESVRDMQPSGSIDFSDLLPSVPKA